MQQAISDAHLFGLLGGLVLLDILFLAFWTFFHPLQLIQKNVTIEVLFHICVITIDFNHAIARYLEISCKSLIMSNLKGICCNYA